MLDAEAPAARPPGPGGGDSGIPRRAGAALASPAYAGGTGGSGASLSGRLNAVARLVQIGSARAGQEGFDPGLLADAGTLLARAGERLRLSAHHTIVVLAGGTGSGKSSLFGAGLLRDIMARTRADLRHRIKLILDEEMRRFADVIDAVGTPDAAASLHLYQATYALEVAR